MTGERARRGRIPRATYRMQVRREFDFDAVREQLPYLVSLGISDVYLSPILQAVPGSTHGYDVTDPTALSADLGGEAAFDRMVEELRRLDLGLIVDIVPNHMGIADGANAWWEDVLRLGRESAYADVFDIDWDVPDPDIRGHVLLPILADHLDAVLARREIAIKTVAGAPFACYGDRRLPLAPGTFESLLGADVGDPATLRRLLEAQHYRLIYWREGKPRINYRRFFEVDTLVGVRQEDPAVFERTHAVTLRLIRSGAVTGLRIDHIDGLADPAAYLDRLRAATSESGEPPLYVVVEKILGRGEALPASWSTFGTTGYEFLNDVARVMVVADGAARIERDYRDLTGRTEAFEAIAYETRRAVCDGPLDGRFAATLRRLQEAAGDALPGVDATSFSEAARALIASLPVYRTYHTEARLDVEAPRFLSAAEASARAVGAGGDAAALRAARDLLASPPTGEARRVVMALQQLTPAVAAKGIEDASLYRYVPLASLNTVGAEPGASLGGVAEFHRANATRLRDWPHAMTTVATHDHKRGPDASFRISALSLMPEEWEAAFVRWSALNQPRNLSLRPHPHDEYLLYQTILGSWPGASAVRTRDDDFIARIQAYMIKALREGGERTRWIGADEEYEAALTAFVAAILDPARSQAFLFDLERLSERTSHAGMVASLAATVLRITSPGVPDTYQGGERWDLSLVDPDNRRPVDYAARARLQVLAHEAQALLAHWHDGEVLQHTLARTLAARRDHPALFAEGAYRPLALSGARAEAAIAFARQHGEECAISVVPRVEVPPLGDVAGRQPWSPDWGDTRVALPAALLRREYRDAITGRVLTIGARQHLRLAEVLGDFPVALLVAYGGADSGG